MGHIHQTTNWLWCWNSDNEYEEYIDDKETAYIVPYIKYIVDANGRFMNQQPTYDKILHSEVSLQLGEEMLVIKVTNFSIGLNGTIAGTYDENLYLNLRIYEAELPAVHIK